MSLSIGTIDVNTSEKLIIKRNNETDKVVALAGNPNVGKSTVFNALTGLNQHTGNWPGKTVTNAQGYCEYNDEGYVMVDLPGCYSLMAHSAEEEVARDFLCFQNPDAVVVVCDATCLERNLNLVLQALEINPNVVVCVNLIDEAKKKKIKVDIQALSKLLGVPVVETAARNKKGLDTLMENVSGSLNQTLPAFKITYPAYIESAVLELIPAIEEEGAIGINAGWLALKLLEGDKTLISSAYKYLHIDFNKNERVGSLLEDINRTWRANGITEQKVRDDIVQALVRTAESISRKTVIHEDRNYNRRDRRLDKILTSKWTGFPIMFLVLLILFWITIVGANYPSELLSGGLFWIEGRLLDFFIWIHAPEFLTEMLVLGIYRVLAWVVSVMLPPMAIFFPLFTLMEDLGYLPRIAFNLDKIYKKCCACGKQALTMCMGFGCNAVGVTGCRIIDSPRERLIAIITNNFVPCNGRFPCLIAIISMFFIGTANGLRGSVLSAILLTFVIVFGIMMTFLISRLLSKTILKGVPSSFTLELPPYRKPQVGKIIVRSMLDRTLFVLGRAVTVAAPAGLIIWLLANITLGGATLLAHCSGFLDPFAKLFGMDGIILLAFILGLPANEIVIPIMIMAYTAEGNLVDIANYSVLKELLVDNGWTWVTAVSVMLFSLMHWPCATTCMTIKKETGSLKWMAISFALPTAIGLFVCFVFSGLARLIL